MQYKHLAGRHNQQDHGRSKITAALVGVNIPSLGTPSVTTDTDDIYSHRISFSNAVDQGTITYSDSADHLTIMWPEVNRFEEFAKVAEVIAKNLGISEIQTTLYEKEMIPTAIKYDYTVKKSDLDFEAKNDYANKNTTLYSNFVNHFIAAYARRTGRVLTRSEIPRIVTPLTMAHNKLSNPVHLNQLNTYGLFCLQMALTNVPGQNSLRIVKYVK